MNDLKQLLGFPFQERQWFIKLIIGGAITLVPVLNFISLGYFLRCVRYGWTCRRVLPEWYKWGDLFKEGCLAFLIILAYLLLPFTVAWLIAILPLVGSVLAIIVILVMGLVIPMALAAFAIQRDIMDAFIIGEILVRTGRVLNYYLTAYFIAIIGFMVGFAVIWVPYIGFLGGVIIFYSGAVFFNLVGVLYYKAG